MISDDFAEDLLRRAKKKGATEGDVLLLEQESFTAGVRLGAVEKISHSQERCVGMRLFVGRRSATTCTSDLNERALTNLIEETIEFARATADDPHAGLPPVEYCPSEERDLVLCDADGHQVAHDRKIDLARRAELSALNADPRIKNSEGAEFGSSHSRVIYAGTNGFSRGYEATIFSFSTTCLAAENGQMQSDGWFSQNRNLSLLESPEEIGRRAAGRALRKLGARKVKTQRVPVVFDTETAATLLRSLSAACSGYSIFRGASFLIGKLGAKIASEYITILDDGSIPGALGSEPFDGEGVRAQKTTVIEKGVLANYLLDTYSASRTGLQSTGNATRSPGGPLRVAPHNFYVMPGPWIPEDIIGSVESGFYVTNLMGFGVNLVTGDYSRGASGLWIEKGSLQYPVEEVTIAGNLTEMLLGIEMVGNDLNPRSKISSPTLKISQMTVAGQ